MTEEQGGKADEEAAFLRDLGGLRGTRNVDERLTCDKTELDD